MAGYLTPAWVNDATPAIDAASLIALGEAAELGEHPYGVCSTAAATAAKEVTIDFSGTLALFAGLTVRVKFTYSNTAASPTLNVNGTGAVPIVYAGAAVGNGAWMGNSIADFTFDGTNWNIHNVGIDSTPTANSTNLVTSGGVVDYATPVVGKGINLLDNWYFVGGGGAGAFPINQRGQLTYTGNPVYCIDRWLVNKSTISLISSGLKWQGAASGSNQFAQTIPGTFYYGKELTLSVLTTSGNLTTATLTAPTSGNRNIKNIYIKDVNNNDFLIAWYLIADDGVNLGCMLRRDSVAFEIDIAAIKLELGSVQTLARQVGGQWVLNDPVPDYGTELLKCQTSTAESGDPYANQLPATQQMLASIQATGTTNTTGSAISAGTYFYLNGVLVQAIKDIGSGASFTLNTNYEVVTAGGLNDLMSALANLHIITYDGTMPASETTAVTQAIPGADTEYCFCIGFTAKHAGNNQWYQLGTERFESQPIMNNGNLRFTGLSGQLTNFVSCPYRAYIFTR